MVWDSMLFRTTFTNEQLDHLREKQSLRWKISEDTSLSFNIRICFDHPTKQKTWGGISRFPNFLSFSIV